MRKHFAYSNCADEIFLQTIVWQDETLRSRIAPPALGCLRKIDWTRGKPYTWQMRDLDELLASPMLFARKFSDNDFALVQALKARVLHL